MDALQHKSFFAKIKETLTRKPTLPEALPKKIEQAKQLCKIEVRRANATGKKMEELEAEGLDQAVEESRVEVNNGEMAKVFDRYAKEARKEGEFFGMYMVETNVAQFSITISTFPKISSTYFFNFFSIFIFCMNNRNKH